MEDDKVFSLLNSHNTINVELGMMLAKTQPITDNLKGFIKERSGFLLRDGATFVANKKGVVSSLIYHTLSLHISSVIIPKIKKDLFKSKHYRDIEYITIDGCNFSEDFFKADLTHLKKLKEILINSCVFSCNTTIPLMEGVKITFTNNYVHAK